MRDVPGPERGAARGGLAGALPPAGPDDRDALFVRLLRRMLPAMLTG
ncbi:hypothetical protein ACFWM7_06690 [Streptomyces sp. NPDC058375]